MCTRNRHFFKISFKAEFCAAILLIILLPAVCSASHHDFIEFGGAAGDVWHLTGSCIGTLAIQKAFKLEWKKAALYMLAAGFLWEVCDEIKSRGGFKNVGFFDPEGFNAQDLLRDCVGISISFPLRR